MSVVLYLQSDNNLKITGLSDANTGAYLNAATITYVITNEADATVTGGTGTLDYLAGSNGNYLAVVDKTVMVLNSAVPFTLNRQFFINVTMVQGNYDRYWKIPATVTYGS